MNSHHPGFFKKKAISSLIMSAVVINELLSVVGGNPSEKDNNPQTVKDSDTNKLILAFGNAYNKELHSISLWLFIIAAIAFLRFIQDCCTSRPAREHAYRGPNNI